MVIKSMSIDEVRDKKFAAELRRMEKLQEELVMQVKFCISQLINIDHVYDIQEHVENIIANWKDPEIEYDEDEEDDD